MEHGLANYGAAGTGDAHDIPTQMLIEESTQDHHIGSLEHDEYDSGCDTRDHDSDITISTTPIFNFSDLPPTSAYLEPDDSLSGLLLHEAPRWNPVASNFTHQMLISGVEEELGGWYAQKAKEGIHGHFNINFLVPGASLLRDYNGPAFAFIFAILGRNFMKEIKELCGIVELGGCIEVRDFKLHVEDENLMIESSLERRLLDLQKTRQANIETLFMAKGLQLKQKSSVKRKLCRKVRNGLSGYIKKWYTEHTGPISDAALMARKISNTFKGDIFIESFSYVFEKPILSHLKRKRDGNSHQGRRCRYRH